MGKANKLTALAVERLSEPGVYGDGAGLSIRVTEGGSKHWILRYMIAGRGRWMGLGPYPEVPLVDAREKAMASRRKVREGIDPIAVKHAEALAVKIEKAKLMTFQQCADKYIETHRASWKNAKHADQWTNTISSYCGPVFGNLPVAEVDTALIVKALSPIWIGKNETAMRLRGRIESVLDWATTCQFRQGDNPARWKGHLEHMLANISRRGRIEHHAAISYAKVGAFMVQLREQQGSTARAMEFAILTAARSGEARGATWDEIDMKAKVWTIPAARMKGKKEHRVPLSAAAIDVLNKAKAHSSDSIVFPGRDGKKPLADMAPMAMLRRMGRADLTLHGFRSTFRDWAAECTAYPQHVCEMALAHAIPNAVEAAYRRGDMFEKRVRMMDEWAAFCNIVKNEAVEVDNVIPIQKGNAAA